MEDLSNVVTTPELPQHIDVCNHFQDVEPETWQKQVRFCRVCLTREKERVEIQFWIDPKLDRLGEAICAIASSFKVVIYHIPPPRSRRCRLAISSVEAIR